MHTTRDAESDLVVEGNRCISSVHCRLVRRGAGETLVQDSSSNGTMLNGKRLPRDQPVLLLSEDVITLVYQKDNPALSE